MTIIAPSSTFNITDPALQATLVRSLGDANRLLSEDEVVYSPDLITFTTSRANWLLSPPPQVWVDGVLQARSTYSAPGDGTITFGSYDTLGVFTPGPAITGDVVTVTYWFNYFNADDLYDFISTGLTFVEGSLGAAGMLIDSTLPRAIKDPILQVAHIRALQSLLTGNLDNYVWKVEGRTVDKSKISPAFINAIKMNVQNLETTLAWLRPQFIAEGQSMVLNIDRGQPPNRFSQFNTDNLLGDLNTN